ncbi:hypothetical protein [Asticcacaulis excentricus]|uniref:hypothetical protein n=1 Tax=Asticcacaulis excentricus TaxID=78587 RepID=UPI000F8314D9|nr:hypothetical protein [Asticcacaulis excentricus]
MWRAEESPKNCVLRSGMGHNDAENLKLGPGGDMKGILFLSAMSLLTGIATPASAMTYFLVRDLGVKDNMRRCLYSNNEIYAYNSTEICPLQIEDDSIKSNRSQKGFYKGEYPDGMTKVCVYDVMGETRSIRINGIKLCPMQAEF